MDFDLEDDDFFDATFLSISENDLLTSTAVSKIISSEQKFNVHPNENLKEDILHQEIVSSSSTVCAIKESSKREDHSKRTFVNKKSKREDEQISILSPILDSSEDSSFINSRFIPGSTPKAKKRKFPGPNGIFLEKLEEIFGIQSAQLSEELLVSSWQNLHKDVSSCPAFLSTAKYYSIDRVLNEASKKKLPKHIEVPVICVLIKKFKPEDSSLIFIDDTGEIPGKIIDDALNAYKVYIKAGTALILRKVTFLCNVLLFWEKSVASIYLEDGSVKHIHELNSILEESLKPMSRECPGTSNANESRVAANLKVCDATPNVAKKSPNSILLNSEANSKTPCPNSYISKQRINSSSPNNLSSSWSLPNVHHFSKALVSATPIGNSSNVIPSVKQDVSRPFLTKPTNTVTNINVSHIASKASDSPLPSNQNMLDSEHSIPNNSVEADDLFCDGPEMDEFDELLCNLDEKSFLEEI